MAVTGGADGLGDGILYLMVTCSMDPSRATMAQQVVNNLVEQNMEIEFFSSLIVFDNASRYDEHLSLLPDGVAICQSDRNVGYWNAIQWTLDNYERLLGRNFEFIYIIESDLVHRNMHRLSHCARFLRANEDVGSIRTQEFSVRGRWFYDKRMRFLPFVRRHSWVVLHNAITRDATHFEKADRDAGIYRSNFHTKLPALNRMGPMKEVFGRLREKNGITEMNFIEFYHDLYKVTGVLDGGIYRTMGNVISEDVVTGSWTDNRKLEELGYQATRIGQIETDTFTVKQLCPAKEVPADNVNLKR